VEDLQIKFLEQEDCHRWDEFVARCSNATFFHLSGWRTVINKAFGHRPYYLYAEQKGELVGVLPLGHIKSILFGNALISVPFCVYGGACADSVEVVERLHSEAVMLAEKLGVDYLELRSREAIQSGWLAKELYVTFRKKLDPDPDKNMLAIPRKQRAMVRKGIKAGLSSELDDDIERFFAAYSESVRNLGTPIFSKKYFRILHEVFGSDCEILTVTRNGRLIASVMSFYFRDEVLPYYGGGTSAARALKGNDFMYWELMRRSCERGIRVFDFGRSKQGTGSYSFKKNWGFEPTPLYYQYKLVRAKEIPDINPLNPKYKIFIKTWKKLPLVVSNFVGPFLAKNLG